MRSIGRAFKRQSRWSYPTTMPLELQIAAMHKKSTQSLWLDPSDLSTLWQDSAGTVAAANKLRVSRVDDRSGKGNHATQATDASRPHLVDDMVLWFGPGTSLVANFADALGSDCTVASAVPGTGVDIQTGVTIGSGAYSISADTAGFMLFDRALTARETSLVQKYLEMKLAILEFVEFDFAALPIDPRITFTRASAGTYFDANGVMQTAAINQPRIDHDPVTGEVRGLLAEELRTNSLLNSATLATQSVTVTAAARTLSFYGTGTVTLSGASTAGPLVGTGANDRVWLTFTPTAGTLTLTVSGSVTKAQLEAGAFPTSYVPTEGTVMTRAADVAAVNDLSSIRYSAEEGTLFGSWLHGENNGAAILFGLWDGTFNNRSMMFSDGSTDGVIAPTVSVTAAGNSQFAATLGQISPNTPHKMALAYRAGDFAAVRDIAALAAGASGAPPVVNRAAIGCGSGGAFSINGHIRRLRYYPRRLSNTELQELTA